MQIHFVGQPFADQQNLLDFIEHTRSGGFDELRIAVAWAKRSGLSRVWDALSEFRNQGGKVTLIVGVSEGGATKEGLEIARDIADSAYVFHDPGRTFHPKVYLASSAGPRSLMVGSSNLTAGGLGWNYEASLWVDFDAGESTDITDHVVEWFDALVAEPDACAPLTTDLIEKLEQSSDIMLGSERRARRVQKTKHDTPEDTDSAVAATVQGLFKAVQARLRKLPKQNAKFLPTPPPTSVLTPSQAPSPATSGSSANNPATKQAPVPGNDAELPDGNVMRRWVKKMDGTAAQQPQSATTNPTGNLRLNMETASVDHKVYFRNDFFGGLPWTPTPGKDKEQEVIVGFHIWINGFNLGIQELRVSHDPGRIAGQGNVPTVLHWGPIGKELRAQNYVGFFVSLECTTNGEFNLVISDLPRGSYLV